MSPAILHAVCHALAYPPLLPLPAIPAMPDNLWIDLEALKTQLQSSGGVLKLPLIKNKKVG